MGYINVDPITKKVKEYANSGEWLAAVEKATSGPKPKPVGKLTYAEASKKLREEVGIDLRSPAEKEQIKFDEAVGKAVSSALAQRQAMQSSQAKQEGHSSPLEQANAAMARLHEIQKSLGLAPKACGCHAKHSQKAETVTHSAYAVGPVMGMQRVSWPEAQKRLRAAGVEI